MSAALTLTDVRIQLGRRPVLTGLSLSAAVGEVTAVLGPNGAGKTTMIRCCTGLLSPDAGTIDVLGRAAGAPGANDRVGLMPQATGAWSGVRPLELLRYLAALYASPLPVAELVEMLGIGTFAQTPYRRLSGGQQQLVNLAGAIIGRPELVFLDEPTAGLDPHVRRTVWQLIRDLRAAGVAVVLTTHAMDEAEKLADRVILLNAGRAVASGTVGELTADGNLEQLFLSLTTPGGAA
ncbi:MAG TPA: ABC transporter ATP-binding protein [Propionicimonas sp.]|nr:ABC transporter ATP-binding protein [Propionicimonas sp.]HQA78994.1 ABC transporter ATP-binding protein [Propionicimonas sp.]HQD97659.1 ABC transporter ATP-binding protein [Propionicimonas sp.]